MTDFEKAIHSVALNQILILLILGLLSVTGLQFFSILCSPVSKADIYHMSLDLGVAVDKVI